MSDIPEDILAAAENANTMGWHQDRVKSIALAILAERERCRLIAVDVAQEADGGEYYIAHLIASAIHNPPSLPLIPLPAAETSETKILPVSEDKSSSAACPVGSTSLLAAREPEESAAPQSPAPQEAQP